MRLQSHYLCQCSTVALHHGSTSRGYPELHDCPVLFLASTTKALMIPNNHSAQRPNPNCKCSIKNSKYHLREPYYDIFTRGICQTSSSSSELTCTQVYRNNVPLTNSEEPSQESIRADLGRVHLTRFGCHHKQLPLWGVVSLGFRRRIRTLLPFPRWLKLPCVPTLFTRIPFSLGFEAGSRVLQTSQLYQLTSYQIKFPVPNLVLMTIAGEEPVLPGSSTCVQTVLSKMSSPK